MRAGLWFLRESKRHLRDSPAAVETTRRRSQSGPTDPICSPVAPRWRSGLSGFEDAAKSYTKLYELAYKDPQYMVKVAETHAHRSKRPGHRSPA